MSETERETLNKEYVRIVLNVKDEVGIAKGAETQLMAQFNRTAFKVQF